MWYTHKPIMPVYCAEDYKTNWVMFGSNETSSEINHKTAELAVKQEICLKSLLKSTSPINHLDLQTSTNRHSATPRPWWVIFVAGGSWIVFQARPWKEGPIFFSRARLKNNSASAGYENYPSWTRARLKNNSASAGCENYPSWTFMIKMFLISQR